MYYEKLISGDHLQWEHNLNKLDKGPTKEQFCDIWLKFFMQFEANYSNRGKTGPTAWGITLVKIFKQ